MRRHAASPRYNWNEALLESAWRRGPRLQGASAQCSGPIQTAELKADRAFALEAMLLNGQGLEHELRVSSTSFADWEFLEFALKCRPQRGLRGHRAHGAEPPRTLNPKLVGAEPDFSRRRSGAQTPADERWQAVRADADGLPAVSRQVADLFAPLSASSSSRCSLL